MSWSSLGPIDWRWRPMPETGRSSACRSGTACPRRVSAQPPAARAGRHRLGHGAGGIGQPRGRPRREAVAHAPAIRLAGRDGRPPRLCRAARRDWRAIRCRNRPRTGFAAAAGASCRHASSWCQRHRLHLLRRSRADTDSWVLADAPLDVVPEAYRVTVFDGPDVVRVIETTAAAASYAAAAQNADFGGLPASFAFTVAQLSPVLGPGHSAAGAFAA